MRLTARLQVRVLRSWRRWHNAHAYALLPAPLGRADFQRSDRLPAGVPASVFFGPAERSTTCERTGSSGTEGQPWGLCLVPDRLRWHVLLGGTLLAGTFGLGGSLIYAVFGWLVYIILLPATLFGLLRRTVLRDLVLALYGARGPRIRYDTWLQRAVRTDPRTRRILRTRRLPDRIRFGLALSLWLLLPMRRYVPLTVDYGPFSRSHRLTRAATLEFWEQLDHAEEGRPFLKWLVYFCYPVWSLYGLVMVWILVAEPRSHMALLAAMEWLVFSIVYFALELTRFAREARLDSDERGEFPAPCAFLTPRMATAVGQPTFRRTAYFLLTAAFVILIVSAQLRLM